DRLRHERGSYDEDIDVVAIPHRGLPKSDDRSGRHERFADPPPPQLAPVDLVDVQIGRRHRDGVGRLAAKHPQGDGAGRLNLNCLNLQTAADYAVAQCRVHPAVDGRVGYRRDAIQVIQGTEEL